MTDGFFLSNHVIYSSNLKKKISKKKSVAQVRRVSTSYTFQTSELDIFSRNPPQKSKTSKSEYHICFKTFIVKHVHAKFQLSSCNTDGLTLFFFTFFQENLRIFQKNSAFRSPASIQMDIDLFLTFQNFKICQNQSKANHATTSKACSCKISTL
jgi:hypothetical protein